MLRLLLALGVLVLVVVLAVKWIPRSLERASTTVADKLSPEPRDVLPNATVERALPQQQIRAVKREVEQVVDQGAAARLKQLERDLGGAGP